MEAIPLAQRRGPIGRGELEPPAAGEQVGEPRDERAAIACVWRDGSLPGLGADDVGGPWEHQLEGRAAGPARQRAARVVDVKVGEHDDVDVVWCDPDRSERLEEYVVLFDHAVALAERGVQERADPGLEQ